MTAAWPADATRFLAFRLGPGADLRQGLEAAFAAEPEPSGFVASCVGSLARAALRYAGEDGAGATAGPLELVSLSGTLSADGPHLHASVADAEGRVTGGHVLPGCVVRTTAEVVVGLTGAVVFARSLDPATSYAELSVTPAAPAAK